MDPSSTKQSMSFTSFLPPPTKNSSEKDSCPIPCIHPKGCQCCVDMYVMMMVLEASQDESMRYKSEHLFNACQTSWSVGRVTWQELEETPPFT